MEHDAPEEDVRLVDAVRADYATAMPADRKSWITALATWIETAEITLESANERLYAIPSELSPEGNAKEMQKAFFTDIYQLLFARKSGPRLATFLAAVPKADYLHLLAIS